MVARDFADADQTAVGGRDKNFVGRVEIVGAESLLNKGEACFGRDFEKNAAGDALEAAGAERRGEDFVIFHGEDVGGSAFGNFAALVEEDHFIEAFFLRFGDGPDVREPGDRLEPGEWGSGGAAVFAKSESHGFAIFREARRVNNKVDWRLRFVALPVADLVVDEVDARGAFRDFVGANHFVKMDANFCGGVGYRHVKSRGGFFVAAPGGLLRGSVAPGKTPTGVKFPPPHKAPPSAREL